MLVLDLEVDLSLAVILVLDLALEAALSLNILKVALDLVLKDALDVKPDVQKLQ